MTCYLSQPGQHEGYSYTHLSVGAALWTALKTLEESASLTQHMIQQAYQRGHERLAHNLEKKLHQTERRVAILMSVFQKKEEDIATETTVQESTNEVEGSSKV